MQDTFQPQRKPKKAKASKAAPGYNAVYGEQVQYDAPYSTVSCCKGLVISKYMSAIKPRCGGVCPIASPFPVSCEPMLTVRQPLQGRAEVQVHGSGAIRTLDVQGLVLWVLDDGMNPRWCFVKVFNVIKATTMHKPYKTSLPLKHTAHCSTSAHSYVITCRWLSVHLICTLTNA